MGSGLTVELLVGDPVELAECPVWDERCGVLRWLDIPGHVLHQMLLDNGEHREIRLPVRCGSLVLGEGEGIIVAANGGFAKLRETTGDFHWIASIGTDDRMNDGKCDPAGRFLAGTIVDDGAAGTGALFQLEKSRVSTLLTGVTISNGLAWSPSGELMYYIDTPRELVEVFDYEIASGRLTRRRTFVDLHDVPGRPDGMTVDADGGVWVAMARGGAAVRRFAPNGETERVIDFPVPNVTSVAFGGPSLDELFVTTMRAGLSEAQRTDNPLAGCVFRVRGLDICGIPANRYVE